MPAAWRLELRDLIGLFPDHPLQLRNLPVNTATMLFNSA